MWRASEQTRLIDTPRRGEKASGGTGGGRVPGFQDPGEDEEDEDDLGGRATNLAGRHLIGGQPGLCLR